METNWHSSYPSKAALLYHEFYTPYHSLYYSLPNFPQMEASEGCHLRITHESPLPQITLPLPPQFALLIPYVGSVEPPPPTISSTDYLHKLNWHPPPTLTQLTQGIEWARVGSIKFILQLWRNSLKISSRVSPPIGANSKCGKARVEFKSINLCILYT